MNVSFYDCSVMSGKQGDAESVGGGSSVPTESKIKVEWSPENEEILVEWCDAAQCYKWLHARSHVKYSRSHAWFTIPAIILSTISGTASFAQESMPTNFQALAPLAIGSLNIFIGILTTIQQYLKISELNESHRVMSIAWDKYARNIRIELAKPPPERSDAGSFLKLTRQEFDRLVETSPPIDQKVIDEFMVTFKGAPGTEQRHRYENLKKPDICNIIVTANEARHKWYLEVPNDPTEEILQRQAELAEQERMIKEKEHGIIDKQIRKEHARQNFKRGVQEAADKYKSDREKLDEYVKNFVGLYTRNPIPDEIRQYANTYMAAEITPDNLDLYLREYTEREV
jgi:hypothetical protein